MSAIPTLRLESYDPQWPARFEAMAEELRAALGDTILALEHVGSTAVPGLSSKPVIDVAIAVASEAAADACVAPLEQLGFEYRGLHGDDSRRRYYVLNTDGVRFAHIHLYILPAAAWDEKLAFRDALRADPALAAAYAAEKYRVAEEVGWDKAAYSVAKGPFVERVLAKLRPKAPRPLAAGRALGIFVAYLATQFFVALLVVMTFQLMGAGQSPAALLTAAVLGLGLSGVVVFRMARRSFPGSLRDGAMQVLGWSRSSPQDMRAAAGLGFAIAAFAGLVLLPSFPREPGQTFGPVARMAASPGLSRLVWLAMALVLAPPTEEFLFRGVMLQGFTRSWGRVVAPILVTLAFVSLHLTETRSYWPALVAILMLSLGALAARLLSRSLGPPVVVHVAYNLGVVMVAMFHSS